VSRARTPRSRAALDLLAEVAADLAARVEDPAWTREARAEARRLLMAAWLVQSRPARGAGSIRTALDAARRMDCLIAAAALPVMPPPARPRRAVRWPVSVRPRWTGLVRRIDAFERSVDALVRRTRRMVEHAEAAAGASPVRPAPGGPPPGADAGREAFELVWGETER